SRHLQAEALRLTREASRAGVVGRAREQPRFGYWCAQSTTTLKSSAADGLMRARQLFVSPGDGKLSTMTDVASTFAGPPLSMISPAGHAWSMMKVPSPSGMPALRPDSTRWTVLPTYAVSGLPLS